MSNPEATNLNGYYFKDLAGRNLISQESATRQTQFNAMNTQLQTLIASGLVPYAVDSTSEMINHNRIYVLKSTGKWYYYNTDSSTWTIGGDYQASQNDSVLTTIREGDGSKLIDMSSIVWDIGGVDPNSHKITTQTDRIRTKSYIHCKAGSVIKFTADTSEYVFKVDLYNDLHIFYNTFISEPVQFTDLASTFTIPVDSYIIITIKNRDATEIEETAIPTIAGYISTSALYKADEEEFTGDITDKLIVYDGYTVGFSSSNNNGALYVDSTYKTFHSFAVKQGDYIGLNKIDNSSNTDIKLIFLDKDNVRVEGNTFSTPQQANGSVVPANSKYAVLSIKNVENYFILKSSPSDFESQTRLLCETPTVKLIAHRGLEKFAPEATIPAYTIAGEKGMWGCKLDICETADGYFVMSHDTTVDRMFNGSGSIASMTLAQLQELTVDAGNNIELYPNEKIVTFEKALEICKHYNMHPIIEMKHINDLSSVARIVKILEDYGLLNATLCQCSDGNKSYIMQLRNINKNIPIMYWQSSPSNLSATIIHTCIPLTNSFFVLSSWNTDYTNQGYLDILKSYGMPVCVAVIDGSNALTKINTAIGEGCIYAVTDQITPADIAPDTYPTE